MVWRRESPPWGPPAAAVRWDLPLMQRALFSPPSPRLVRAPASRDPICHGQVSTWGALEQTRTIRTNGPNVSSIKPTQTETSTITQTVNGPTQAFINLGGVSTSLKALRTAHGTVPSSIQRPRVWNITGTSQVKVWRPRTHHRKKIPWK